MIVRGDVQMSYDVFAFDFNVHGPSLEVHLAHVLTCNYTLLRCGPGFVSCTSLEVALVLEHDLLAGDLDTARSIRAVGRHACVGVRDGYARGRRRSLRRGETDIRKGTNRLAAGCLAGHLHIV